MIREVDLVSYLPPFMQEYKELVAALEAESPEFCVIWRAVDKVLRNRFISTADEYGISRFEKLLGVYPQSDDTLESRRSRVQSKWFSKLPYTLQTLTQKIIVLCGSSDFELTYNFDTGYVVVVETGLELCGQVEELESILDELLPCNIVASTKNTISSLASGSFNMYGGIAFAEDIYITS